MTNDQDSFARMEATVRKYRMDIMGIAAAFHRPGCFRFNAMVCDLSTYLWQVFSSLPPDMTIDNEQAWVYTLLHRKAHKLSRDEERYQSHLEYDADLSNVAYDDSSERLIDKMYYLIRQLDEEEQETVALYLKHGNMLKMAQIMDVSYIKVARRMADIRNKLVRLNAMMGDDFDSNTMYDDEPLADGDKETDNNNKIPTDDANDKAIH